MSFPKFRTRSTTRNCSPLSAPTSPNCVKKPTSISRTATSILAPARTRPNQSKPPLPRSPTPKSSARRNTRSSVSSDPCPRCVFYTQKAHERLLHRRLRAPRKQDHYLEFRRRRQTDQAQEDG